MSYQCQVCGAEHDALPEIGAERPDQWFGIPPHERARRVRWNPDTCVIDDTDFFIRGVIRIPLKDQDQDWGLGVWVSQKRENFQTYLDNHRSDTIGPFFGWLCTQIPYYQPSTLFLKTMAHFRGGDLRPDIVVEPTDHPLARAQKDGITLDEAWRILHFYQNQGR